MSGIGQGTWWGLPRRCTLYGLSTERTQKQFNPLIRPKQTSRVGKCRSMLTWPGSTSSKVAPGVARTALAMASITCVTYMSSTERSHIWLSACCGISHHSHLLVFSLREVWDTLYNLGHRACSTVSMTAGYVPAC